jgi:hypothetical protein
MQSYTADIRHALQGREAAKPNQPTIQAAVKPTLPRTETLATTVSVLYCRGICDHSDENPKLYIKKLKQR